MRFTSILEESITSGSFLNKHIRVYNLVFKNIWTCNLENLWQATLIEKALIKRKMWTCSIMSSDALYNT